MTKIFESPDGGKTIYSRDLETGERKLEKQFEAPEWFLDIGDFYAIITEASEGNTTLQNMLQELKTVYQLSKKNG